MIVASSSLSFVLCTSLLLDKLWFAVPGRSLDPGVTVWAEPVYDASMCPRRPSARCCVRAVHDLLIRIRVSIVSRKKIK